MQGFLPQAKVDMRCSSIRGATQLASVSGSRVSQTVQLRRNNTQRNVECAATHSGVKLPATHLQASQAALQQLQSTKGVNREYTNASKTQTVYPSGLLKSALLILYSFGSVFGQNYVIAP